MSTPVTWSDTVASIISGNTWTADSSSWNGARAKASSSDAINPEASTTFKVLNKTTGVMYFSIDHSTTVDGSSDTANFSIYLDFGATTIKAYKDGVEQTVSPSQTYAINDEFKFEYNTSDIKLYKNDSLIHTYTGTAPSSTYYPQVVGLGTASASAVTSAIPLVQEGALPIEHILYLNTKVPT
jgi:hypothetical protein